MPFETYTGFSGYKYPAQSEPDALGYHEELPKDAQDDPKWSHLLEEDDIISLHLENGQDILHGLLVRHPTLHNPKSLALKNEGNGTYIGPADMAKICRQHYPITIQRQVKRADKPAIGS